MEKRHETEYRDMLSIRSGRPRNGLSMLVAGNSLLLHGVDVARLRRELGPDIDLHRTAIENTFYWDWYYGLRSAFRTGARPDVVVLVLNPAQLTSNAIDGDYSVHMMVDARDIPELGRTIGADRNRMSVFALDKLSFFFGVRAQIRGLILDNLFPDLADLTQFFNHPKHNLDQTLDSRAAARLRQLQTLCSRYGAAFVLVIPPAEEDGGASRMLHIADSQGVTVVMPMAPGVLARSDYSDDFHLNPSGAAKFTPAFAAHLRQVIAYPSSNGGVRISALRPKVVPASNFTAARPMAVGTKNMP